MENEWTDCGLPWATYDGTPCFRDSVKNLPGLLVQTNYGTYLIGHINELRGVCDDCVEFGTDTVVVRYMRVWEGPDPR